MSRKKLEIKILIEEIELSQGTWKTHSGDNCYNPHKIGVPIFFHIFIFS